MRLRWERPRDGLARGFGVGGHELAQIAHVYSAVGDDLGWMVLLMHDQGELFDHFHTADLAMRAAEEALAPQPPANGKHQP